MSAKTDDAAMTGVGCLLMSLLTLPLAFWNAWVLSHMWGWFVTPTFGKPVPSLAMLAGLVATVRIITVTYRKADDDTLFETVIGSTVFQLQYGLAVLGFGFILNRMAS